MEYESDDEYVTAGDYMKGIGKYEGDRNELGERHGNGKASYGNGDVYTGEFCNGKRNGTGKYNFQIARYSGEYKNGKRHGSGTMVYPDGSKYTGEWENGMKNGKGEYTFANGDRFEGQWIDDAKHGTGIYYYKDTGSQYEAKWVDGQQTGSARWVHTGHQYQGLFKEGAPCGRGKYTFSNGCEQHGFYVVKDIVQKIDKRMELVGREPVWHARLLTHTMSTKDTK